jgi:hypothetical protein
MGELFSLSMARLCPVLSPSREGPWMPGIPAPLLAGRAVLNSYRLVRQTLPSQRSVTRWRHLLGIQMGAPGAGQLPAGKSELVFLYSSPPNMIFFLPTGGRVGPRRRQVDGPLVLAEGRAPFSLFAEHRPPLFDARPRFVFSGTCSAEPGRLQEFLLCSPIPPCRWQMNASHHASGTPFQVFDNANIAEQVSNPPGSGFAGIGSI